MPIKQLLHHSPFQPPNKSSGPSFSSIMKPFHLISVKLLCIIILIGIFDARWWKMDGSFSSFGTTGGVNALEVLESFHFMDPCSNVSMHQNHLDSSHQNVPPLQEQCKFISAASHGENSYLILQNAAYHDSKMHQLMAQVSHNSNQMKVANWSALSYGSDSEKTGEHLAVVFTAPPLRDTAAAEAPIKQDHDDDDKKPSQEEYLYFISNKCTIFRNPVSDVMALPKDKIRLSSVLQTPMNFVDITVKMPYVYILGELPTTSKVIVLRLNLQSFDPTHVVLYSMGSDLSSVTWMKLVERFEHLYLAGNQVTKVGRQERSISVPLSNEMNSFGKEFDPVLYSGIVNRISLPSFDESFTFQLYDQSHEIKDISGDIGRENFVYATVLDRTNPIAVAKFYVFNFENSDVASATLRTQTDPLSQFSEILFFNQSAVNYTSVLVALEDSLFEIQKMDSSTKNGNDDVTSMEINKFPLSNASEIIHLSKEASGELFALARGADCDSCLKAYRIKVLPDVPPSNKLFLPPWLVLVVLGVLIGIEYVVIVGACVGSRMWKRFKNRDLETTVYDSIEDEDVTSP